MALKILPHGRLQDGSRTAFGFRKLLDAMFMIGFLVTGPDVTQAEVRTFGTVSASSSCLTLVRHRPDRRASSTG